MEQRDPNAISGLLKLHLRETPFLGAASAQSLQDAMGDMVSCWSDPWMVINCPDLTSTDDHSS